MCNVMHHIDNNIPEELIVFEWNVGRVVTVNSLITFRNLSDIIHL